MLATTFHDLWPLAGVMGTVTPESVLGVAERIAAAPLPREEWSELTGLLGLLSGLRLRQRDVLAALRRNQMIDELVRESGFAEEFFNEGKAEGKAAGMRASIRLVLEGRFGPLDQALLDAIGRLPNAELEEIVTLSAKGTLEDVRKRLGLG